MNDKLKREVSKTNIAIKKATDAGLKKRNLFGMLITFHSQDSPLKTEGAPIEVINIDSVNIRHTIYHKNIHNSLYEFFTNLGSILDRLTFEINHLYQLGDWLKDNIDWNRLVNPQDKLKLLESLKRKDARLSQFIKKKSSDFKDVNYYRNRLIHDAVLNTKIDLKGFPRKINIFLPDDPRNMDSPNNIDAIDYCKILKANLLILLDGSYNRILEHINTHGNPPW